MSVLFARQQELLSEIERELWPIEQVRWMGQPVPFIFAKTDLKSKVRGSALIAAIPALVLALSVPYFLGIILWLPLTSLFFPFVLAVSLSLAYLEARRKVYVITNQRMLVISRLRPGQTDQYGVSHIKNIEVRESHDGVGDLIVAQQLVETGAADATTWAQVNFGFYAIPNVRAVANMLQETMTISDPI